MRPDESFNFSENCLGLVDVAAHYGETKEASLGEIVMIDLRGTDTVALSGRIEQMTDDGPFVFERTVCRQMEIHRERSHMHRYNH